MKHFDINKLLNGKIPINISVDSEARAIYFKVSDDEVLRTDRPNEFLSIDYGKNDEVIGVEVVRLNKIQSAIKIAYKDLSSAIPSRALASA